jgi:hypothetical protein
MVFGGALWPIGWQVGFVERPLEDVYAVTRRWRRRQWGVLFRYGHLKGRSLIEQLRLLQPLQSPHKRELLVATSSDWTAYFGNGLLGGDPDSYVGYISAELDCRGVIASHIPADQYPMPATRFELLGPTGEKPLRYVRSVSAGIFDEGHWTFEAHGEQQPFEQLELYNVPRVRDRFTREMLLRYLAALGLDADNPAFYRDGILIRCHAPFKPRTLTVDEARHEYLPSS